MSNNMWYLFELIFGQGGDRLFFIFWGFVLTMFFVNIIFTPSAIARQSKKNYQELRRDSYISSELASQIARMNLMNSSRATATATAKEKDKGNNEEFIVINEDFYTPHLKEEPKLLKRNGIMIPFLLMTITVLLAVIVFLLLGGV